MPKKDKNLRWDGPKVFCLSQTYYAKGIMKYLVYNVYYIAKKVDLSIAILSKYDTILL